MLHHVRRFFDQTSGTSAIEFAFVAPVYFFLVFGTLEVGLMTWFSTLLSEGAEQAGDYMRRQRMDNLPITDAGIRTAVCGSVRTGGLSCDAAKLKIAPYYAGQPVTDPYVIPPIIENQSDPRAGSGGQYILALGYNWGLTFSTSRLLLPMGPDGGQIQAFSYTVLAERVGE